MKTGSSQQTPAPQLLIFLATFQGEKYLARQLDSYLTQTWPHWAVQASDDGSRDATLGILHAYRSGCLRGRLSVQAGAGRGFVRNFLGMACTAPVQARHYAFSDQDDIWLPHKLARAVRWLETVDAHTPALYCGSAALVDADGRITGHCWRATPARPPGFANALTQNLCGGNTMVFNHAARELLRRAGSEVCVPFHDWWLYLLVSGCGGRVFHDPDGPVIHYRQHADNTVGMKNGWLRERLHGLQQISAAHFARRLRQNLCALEGVRGELTAVNRHMLDAFTRACQAPAPWQRLRLLRQSGVYRQTWHGNLGLALAAGMGCL